MQYIEKKTDLFTVPEDYALVHCISSDFAMGAGIAKKFTEMGVKEKLVNTYPRNKWDGHGYSIAIGMKDYIVINLITKEKYWMKPTYQALGESLESMKDWVVSQNRCYWVPEIKLAMPKIGCGLDRLEWSVVSGIIQDVFKDTNIEILVCYQ